MCSDRKQAAMRKGSMFLLLFTSLLVTTAVGETLHKRVKIRRPNIIIFLVDDLGYGDLSPYGHPTSNTPSIQKLADEGLLFTQFYSTSPVDSASRAALLTGRYQTRSGVYPGNFEPDDLGGLPLNETTIAKALKAVGYRTGLFGKWHLGVGEDGKHLPNHHGFDYYTGIPYSHSKCPCYTCFYPKGRCHKLCDPEFVPCPIFECTRYRQQIIQQPADLTNLASHLLNSAVSFIKKNAAKRRPFFMLYSFHHTHGPQFSGERFYNTSKRGAFGDSLREVDYAVRLVMNQIKNNGLDSNTFVFLTSDNGPDLRLGHEGGSAGLLRCGKGSTWEGGVRVPAIARWLGKISYGRTSELGSQLDLFPTILKMAGANAVRNRKIDGLDMSRILYRKSGKSKRDWLAYFPEDADEVDGPFAIRWREYKVHYYTKGGHYCSEDYYDPVCRYNATVSYQNPPLLFNLHTDPGERIPLDANEYSLVIEKIGLIKQNLMYSLEWATPQTLIGQNKTAQPCGRPGCQPFPYCCQVDFLNEAGSLTYFFDL